MIRRLVLLALLGLALPLHAQEAPVPDDSETAPAPSMTLPQAVVLGVVEGVTEYLPVSSTGHLILASRAMNIGMEGEQKEASDAYTICIQAGAIFAVVGLYFVYIRRMFLGVFGRDPEGRRMAINLVVAFLPAMAVGLLLGDFAKQYLFSMWFTVFAWFVGGVVILVLEKGKVFKAEGGQSDLFAMSWKQALLIGCMQCIAIWPGTSRSLVTILGGRVAGLSLPASVVFSFLLGALTLTAATAHDALKHGELMLKLFGPLSIVVGIVTAFISAVIAVKWMVAYLSKRPLSLFGWYRIALAITVAGLILGGWLRIAA